MAKINDNRLDKKRAQLITRTADAFGITPEEAAAILTKPFIPSFRINTLKTPQPERLIASLRDLGWQGSQSELIKHGYSIEAGYDAIRDSSHAVNGELYIQNASSWLPVRVLDPKPGERILDMAAAPGGKSSHIAALTGNKAELHVNDNSKPRLHKMFQTFNVLGVKPASATLSTFRNLPKKLVGSFDKILLDAPCSGEGLIDIQKPATYITWSLAHIKRLQSIQKSAVRTAWQLLAPGGILVYSTCTMAPEENELVIEYLLKHEPDAQVEHIGVPITHLTRPVLSWNHKIMHPQIAKAVRIIPGGTYEGFFVAKVRKSMKSNQVGYNYS